MTINITCRSSHIWKNVYSRFEHNSKFEQNNLPCFKDKPYWEKLPSGSYELTKTIRVSYSGLSIEGAYSYYTLGLFTECDGWQGLPVIVSEEDTHTKLIDDIAEYVLHLTDNYLN